MVQGVETQQLASLRQQDALHLLSGRLSGQSLRRAFAESDAQGIILEIGIEGAQPSEGLR